MLQGIFGMRRQSEAATALWIANLYSHQAVWLINTDD
jgi:hypothetical protein